MVVSYDKSGTIDHLEIFSSKLQLDNGIHTGLSSSEMFSKYNADFLTTDCFAGESWQIYHIIGLSENITLYAHKNSIDGADWFWSVFDNQVPDENKFKCVKDGTDGYSPIFKIPLNYVKNCSLEMIDVKKGGDVVFRTNRK